MTLNRLLITSVVVESRPVRDVAAQYGVSQSWLFELLARYKAEGEAAFAEYVETVWLPSKQVETSTLAAYRSYLDKHFIPTFGRRPMGKMLPSEIQRWVTTATEDGNGKELSAASVRKYHTMLHSIFERALRDRVVTFNPCAHTELPKVIKRKARTLTPAEYDTILASLPAQHRVDGGDRDQHRPPVG